MNEPRTPDRSGGDRAQAYTLEGFVGAAIVLGVVLMALHSGPLAAVMEESGERDRQNQLQQETQDALVVAAAADGGPGDEEVGTLSAFVRAWNGTQFSSDEVESYVLGEVLAEQFGESPRDLEYLISFNFENENGSVSQETVYATSDEEPDTNAVAANYVVTVFGDQEEADDFGLRSSISPPGESAGTVIGVEVTVW
ncbi:hypothetical protein [Halostagnicola sp. A-GB9-2]|uniref:DUF7288 family protein n=1 Tax=Halostagnicola sp. A-GB9-2 TaxID=3048066 RepID=UPI0024C01768|nr:hypothetical protein [Halostagnicola sp. A-GB9-2]MDJ1430691.1 hypothetical protein [Halostagnicola sp. A-GB9-2]